MQVASAQCRSAPPASSEWQARSAASETPWIPRSSGVCPQARNNNDDNSVDSFILTLLQPQLVRFMGSVEICSYLMYEYVFTFPLPFNPLSVSTVFILPHRCRSYLLIPDTNVLDVCLKHINKPKLLVKKWAYFFSLHLLPRLNIQIMLTCFPCFH